MKQIHWFRNDLRVHDHPIFADTQDITELLNIFVIDPDWFKMTDLGFPKMGSKRLNFLLESLKDLKNSLLSLGSDLLVLVGNIEKVFPELFQQLPASRISFQKEDTYEELLQEKALRKACAEVEFITFQGQTLFHQEDIPFEIDQIPRVFTSFRKNLEKRSVVRKRFIKPESFPPFPNSFKKDAFPRVEDFFEENEIDQVDERTAFPFNAGESSALNHLENYVWRTEKIKTYKNTRNGLLGKDYSSKFSPWLANGSLSPRRIYWEIKEFEESVESNISTYWLIFELIWRDFFRFTAKKEGVKIFQQGGILGKSKSYENSMINFQNWMRARTGEDFVDANMLELRKTGFMSNRGRQNVASFLCNELNIDWRWGAAYFESELLDYDVCSNWGNWMYNSGVGNDPRNRAFNIPMQQKKYDPKGNYVRYWLDE